MLRGARVAMVLAAVVGALVVIGSGTGASRTRPAMAAAVDDLEGRFLTTRPSVGPTWVADLAGSGTAERMMLRTLQGLVNRRSAQLYLKDPGDSGAQRWIDEYQSRGLVTVVDTLTVNEVLDRFAGEASGYVLATESEPWTMTAAATIAAADGAVVATPDLVPSLEARGLGLLDDLRGRWPDAPAAYEEVIGDYRDRLPYKGIAVMEAGDASWDFTSQQGIPTVFTRPNSPDWARVSALITASTPGHAVYGYLSDTGEEEAAAVATLSVNGQFLIPTDTSRNLSFHIAVGADRPRARAAVPELDGVAPCSSDQLNVVVAISDGDNLNVPLSRYSRPGGWMSPRRGDIPLGWSIGPQLAILAPTVWDTYVDQASERDELVGIIGYGYAAPPLLPDPAAFYRDSFSLMDQLQMSSFWSLGGGLETPMAGSWTALDGAAGDGPPNGVLIGYGNGSGVGQAFWSPGGRPAFTSGASYADGPGELAAMLRSLLARPAGDRPLVNFVSASIWTSSLDGLVDALMPLESDGVRFLTPAEASACMPDPVDPTVDPKQGECLPAAEPTRSGLALISDTVAGEIKRVPTAVDLSVRATASPAVEAGGTIDHVLTANVDLAGLAERILQDRVRPVVAASYGEELAASAWVELAFDNLVLRVPLADGTYAEGVPVASSTGPAASARWATEDPPGLEVDLGSVSTDSRSPSAGYTVTADWQAVAGSRPESWTATLRPGATSFDLAVTVGVSLGAVSVTGTASAPWSCLPESAPLADTLVSAAAVPATTTTSRPPLYPAPPSSSVQPSTPATPSSMGSSTTSSSAVGPLPSTSAPSSTSGVPPTTTPRHPDGGLGTTSGPSTPQQPSNRPAPARPASALPASPSYTG
jgi:hypothetical protein